MTKISQCHIEFQQHLKTKFILSQVGVDGWGKIKNKDHLSPAEAETGTELGKITMESYQSV